MKSFNLHMQELQLPTEEERNIQNLLKFEQQWKEMVFWPKECKTWFKIENFIILNNLITINLIKIKIERDIKKEII